MKILHIVEDFSVASGGLRTVIQNLDLQLKKRGYQSYILSSNKEEGDAIFIVKSNKKWLYSSMWREKIEEIVKKHQINRIHIHGVWLYPQYIGAKYAIQNKIAMILSPHGMYQPWLWKKNTLIKKLYVNFLSKKWFLKASVIHSITSDETANLKEMFSKKNLVEIPNLISFPKDNISYTAKEKYILYLGRLNKTKGIDLLIKSFSEIKDKNITLKIAGEFNDYKEELLAIVKSLSLETKIVFLGIVKNEIKTNLIKNAWALVSPTYSDVIGMVNLEGASFKTPVITTYNTGLKKEWNDNGGRLINPTLEELKEVLLEITEWSLEERNRNGNKLFNFVKQNYSWEKRISDWEDLYKNS